MRYKIFFVTAPIAACAMQWFHSHSQIVPMASSVLQAGEQDMKLEQVQVVFRHGARSPLSWNKNRFQDFSNLTSCAWDKFCVDLPTDINYIVKFDDENNPSGPSKTNQDGTGGKMEGGCATGQLTFRGQEQLYDLGKWLSEKYVTHEGLVSPSYQRNEVYTRSSNIQRTIHSLLCLLEGFYGKEQITEQVCIESKETKKEDLMPNFSSCTNLIKWITYIRSPEIRSSELHELETYLNDLMGKGENKKKARLDQIGDLIYCRRAHGLSIPQFLLDNESAIEKMQRELNLKHFERNVSVIRNCIGSFLETLCCRVIEGVEGSSSHKMFLYSAHDSTLFTLLHAFEVRCKDHWPPFASHVVIELYKRKDNERFIRVLYNGEPIIPDSDSGQEYLPVQDFLNLVEIYRVKDFDDDCGNS